MYTINYNNGTCEKAITLKEARKNAMRFHRMAKNGRFGLHLNFFTCASITKNGKMLYSVDNAGMEKIYKWNF